MIQTLKNLYWLSRSYKWTILAATAGSLIVQILGLTAPVVLSWFINLLETGVTTSPVHTAVQYALLLLVALLALIAVDMGTDVAVNRVLMGMEGKLSADALSHLMGLPLGYHEKEDTGRNLKKIQRGAEKTTLLIARWGWTGIPILLLFITTVGLIMYHHVWIGLAILAGIPITIAIHMYFHSKTVDVRKIRYDGYEESESILLQAVSNVATVQSYRQEISESRRLRKLWERIFQAGFKEFRYDMVNYGFRGSFKSILTAGLILWAFLDAYRGLIDTGQFALLVMLIWRIDHNLWIFGDVMAETSRESSSIDRLRALFETEPEVKEAYNPVELTNPKGTVTFENVTFTYGDDAQPALDNVTAKLPAGTTTALVGPSGGGKSTFVKKILRASDPQQGVIRFDGHDLRSLSFNYRRYIGYVPQDPQIFDLTVAENIAYGATDVSRHEIEEAAQKAHVEEFVSRLPEGYDTLVGENGVRLSGGQKQRLAIARAIARDPAIFIFDEATSDLDSISERYIQQSFRDIAGTCTVVVIAHRLSTIRAADQILVFRDGKILERGTHSSLQKRNGVYKQLVELQHTGELIGEL